MSFIFYASVLFVLYAFFGYPLLLRLLSISASNSRKRGIGAIEKEKTADEKLPYLCLLISVHNEEAVIEKKILNSLDLDYPSQRRRIIVVSDNSTDRTENIVEGYAEMGVELRKFEKRQGKTACLNMTIDEIDSEILVFSDANSIYNKKALRHLASHFKNGQLGLVSGVTRYQQNEGSELVESVGIYSRYEEMLKALESAFGLCVGADGAIFAMRRALYRAMRPEDINDLVLPLHVIRERRSVILDSRAYCCESVSKNSLDEFNRQTRITARTIRALFNNSDLLNPLNYPLFSLFLLSHKLIRHIVPQLLIVAYISNFILIFSNKAFSIPFLLQSLNYLSLPVIRRSNIRLKPVQIYGSLLSNFLMYNAAILNGWFQYFRGQNYTYWEKPLQ
jgi:cellulose synthase/poly-beta-1,6-N-acetylglucosamine synthase-like glycosyltransferase